MDPPRLTSIYANANAIAPGRRKSSDGTLGDAAHRASGGDHNPDSRGVVHAIDISQSMPGTPYWEPRFQQFDVFANCRRIVAAYVAASAAERASRWPWLADGGYMVWFEAGRDVIFNPSVSLTVRQNGAAKQEHNQHAHHSIGHTARSENDTQPIFGEDDDVTPQDKKDIVDGVLKVLRRQPDGTPGLIGDEVAHVLGGYKDGHWVDGLAAATYRNDHGLSQSD